MAGGAPSQFNGTQIVQRSVARVSKISSVIPTSSLILDRVPRPSMSASHTALVHLVSPVASKPLRKAS
jgi:hypothetical protein